MHVVIVRFANTSFSSAKVVMERDTGRSRGFGFVTFEVQDSVDKAIRELDNSVKLKK